METISIVCIVIAVICLILIWFISIYNRFQANIIRINEVEADIDNVLRKRFDLLNKSIAIIKKNLPEEEPLKIIEELHSKKMSNFELDRALYQAINEFDIYKDQIKDGELKKIDLVLTETEADLIAYRKYYNDVTTDYNKLRHLFPSNIVAALCGYKNRNYYDNKNLTSKDNLKL